MAITYGYFNSLNGDRTYNADQMSEYFDGLVSDGVYEDVGGGLQVLAGSGMTVNVQPGRGIINCKWLKNSAVLPVDINQSHVTLNRYTAVVMRLDYVNRLMTITTKDGTPASSPVKPTMQDDASAKELCLAYVYVGAGVTSITQANITDARASADCGWVTGLIDQVDTSQLFLQWQDAYENYYEEATAEFAEWFRVLTRQLNVNTFVATFQKRVTFDGTAGETVIPLDMTGYKYESTDYIDVVINGLKASLSDVSIVDQGEGKAISILNASKVGTEICITIQKSMIGFNILIDANGNNITDDQGVEVLV